MHKPTKITKQHPITEWGFLAITWADKNDHDHDHDHDHDYDHDHTGAATVRIRHMEVPDAVRAGTEVALNCDYDLQVEKKIF